MSERKSYKNRQILKAKRKKIRKIKSRLKNKSTKKGVYIGPGKKYFLSDDALNHIIHGDFTNQLVVKNGKRTGEKISVLKGGLHTYEAWISFKSSRKGVSHLRFYNSNFDACWYFARELFNGVITLKIPREFYQGAAAKSTKNTEDYYKSGYLWKTLFPKGTGKNQVIKIVDEALKNINQEESSPEIIFGYANRYHPSKILRIRIQLRGRDIVSAFPAWGQPVIGNVGKPYSQMDSIGFTMSQSTVFFDEVERLYKPPKHSKIYDGSVVSVVENAPEFIKSRSLLADGESSNEWRNKRLEEVIELSRSISEKEIKEIYQYAQDPILIKEGYLFEYQTYLNYRDNVIDAKTINSLCFTQNIIDILNLFSSWDELNKKQYTVSFISFALKNMITHADILSRWSNKIIHTEIAKVVNKYYDDELISEYINALAFSPYRLDLYAEFDLNKYWKNEIDVSDPEQDDLLIISDWPGKVVDLNESILDDFSIHNLPDNYHVFFSKEDLYEYVIRMKKYKGDGYSLLIKNTLQHSCSSDFDRFSKIYGGIIDRVIKNNIQGVQIESIVRITLDYFRVQLEYRRRHSLANPEHRDLSLFDFEPRSEELRAYLIIKHERDNSFIYLDIFLNKAIEVSEYLGEEGSAAKFRGMLKRSKKELPPAIFHDVPAYIDCYKNQEDESWRSDFYKGLSKIPF